MSYSSNEDKLNMLRDQTNQQYEGLREILVKLISILEKDAERKSAAKEWSDAFCVLVFFVFLAWCLGKGFGWI